MLGVFQSVFCCGAFQKETGHVLQVYLPLKENKPAVASFRWIIVKTMKWK